MLILLLLLSALLNQASSSHSSEPISFTFPSFSRESCSNGRLICTGAVTAYDGYLSLTSEPLPGNSNSPPLDKVGRVLYHQPVLAWPATIVTSFTLRISPYPNSNDSGDGMTFILAPNNSPSPPSSYGSYLGLRDEYAEGGNVQQLAVELDTYKNDFDPDGNHVAIDTKNVTNPIAVQSLNSTGVDLKSGKDIKVRIEYNGQMRLLYVNVHYSDRPPKTIIKQSLNISDVVPSSVYVGFTAATGAFSESHQILDWTFITTPLPSYSLGK